MNGEMYWLDVDGDRTGLEVIINGIPAERLLQTHAVRFPINEYLHAGVNRVEVRMGPWQSNAAPDDGGEVSLQLVCASFDRLKKVDERIVVQERKTFQAAPAGRALVVSVFAANCAGMDLPDCEPIGAAEHKLIHARLSSIAQAWRDGDGDTLANWMRGYLHDYVRAYPLERQATMEDRVRRMAATFRGGRVDFSSPDTRLEPVAGANLVDCIGPNGAAVQVYRAATVPYNMWAVVGVRNGEVILFR